MKDKTITIKYNRYRQLLRNEKRLLKIKIYVALINNVVKQYNKKVKTIKSA